MVSGYASEVEGEHLSELASDLLTDRATFAGHILDMAKLGT